MTYEICKNNEHVAQLTLPRNVYRLGETIVLILNFTNSTIPCYRVSIHLESVEQVDGTFAAKSKQQVMAHTRRIHAEAQRSTINLKRLVVPVTIPMTGTPDFQSTAGSVQWTVKLAFLTGPTKVMQTSDNRAIALGDGFVYAKGVSHAAVDSFDCTIGLKIYGAFKSTRKSNRKLKFNLSE